MLTKNLIATSNQYSISFLTLHFTLDMSICQPKVTHTHPKSARVQDSTLISRIHLVPWMVPTWIVCSQHTCRCHSKITRVQSPRIVFCKFFQHEVLICADWVRGQQWMRVYTRMHRGMILPFQMINITWQMLGTNHAINSSFPIMVFAITWLNGVMQVSGKNIASLLTISNFP
jgi:hypothetical protein